MTSSGDTAAGGGAPGVGELAWFDGEVRRLADVRVSPLAHGLHYGTGVFEGIRCYALAGGGSGVFRLRDHVERLHASARVLGLALPWDVDALCEAALEVVRRNELEAAYLRPLAWLGEGGLGVAGGDNPVHVLIAAWRWGAYLGEEGLRRGVRVVLSSHERATRNALAQRAKITGQYVTSFLAKRQALALGLDEALLLDRDGHVAEGSGENLFVARDGVLCTPPDDAAILLGITRDTVLALAADLGLDVRRERLSRADLYLADEAFLTGTAAEVTPVREVDGRALRASPGPITRAIQEAYGALVAGRGPRAEGWVERV